MKKSIFGTLIAYLLRHNREAGSLAVLGTHFRGRNREENCSPGSVENRQTIGDLDYNDNSFRRLEPPQIAVD